MIDKLGIPQADGKFNPYPGLRPFQFDDAHLFFGRDEQRNELLERLRVSRFLAVVGTSGSGKSSLVRAGLLPGLHGGFMDRVGARWRIADTRPGGDPIGRLAAALDKAGVLRDEALEEEELSFTEMNLRRSALGLVTAVREAQLPPNERLLILVDQFEELFRFVDETDLAKDAVNDASLFVKLLLAAVHQSELPIYVVLTMRTDYLGDCARFRDLPEAINDGQYLIPRLTRSQRREAIVGPAAIQGVRFSPILLNRLLNDVGDIPDHLPILQHALMRTWENWQREDKPDSDILLKHYLEIGGMDDALSRHAESIYNGLAEGCDAGEGKKRQLIAEKMFKCLTEETDVSQQIRRLATVQEIANVARADTGEVIEVINRFRQVNSSFLMPPLQEELNPDTYIDISHESLIRNWKRLDKWAHGEALSADIYQRLAHAARQYNDEKEDLLVGRRLRMALEWEQEQQPNEDWALRYDKDYRVAMEFLDKSEIKKLAALETASNKRRLRATILAGMVVSVVIAILYFALGNLELLVANEQLRRDDKTLTQALEMWHGYGAEELSYEQRQEIIAVLSKLKSENHTKLADRLITTISDGEDPIHEDTQLYYVLTGKRIGYKVLEADYENTLHMVIARGFESRKFQSGESIYHLVTVRTEDHPRLVKALKLIGQIASYLVLGSVLPFWRWYSLAKWRRDRIASKPKVNPIWRVFAAGVDLSIAIFLGVLAGAIAGMFSYISESFRTLTEISSDDAFMVGAQVGFPVAALYWMLRDGIRFRYHRSLGKVVFGLCPMTLSGEQLNYKISMKYHCPLVIMFALIYLLILLDEMGAMDAYEAIIVTIVIVFFVYAILMLVWLVLAFVKAGRTLADRFAGVRVVDVRSLEARQLELKTISNRSARKTRFIEVLPGT